MTAWAAFLLVWHIGISGGVSDELSDVIAWVAMLVVLVGVLLVGVWLSVWLSDAWTAMLLVLAGVLVGDFSFAFEIDGCWWADECSMAIEIGGFWRADGRGDVISGMVIRLLLGLRRFRCSMLENVCLRANARKRLRVA